jgi:hypothetical protein
VVEVASSKVEIDVAYTKSVRHPTRTVTPANICPFSRHSPAILTMFVPRAVRLKGVKEAPRPKAAKPSTNQQASKDVTNSKDALVEAMGETSMNSPAPQQDTASDAPAPTRGPRFTTKPVTAEYIAQLAAGIQLIFTDYAHQEESRASWLKERYREIDGEENCS